MILHIISDEKFLDKGLYNFNRVTNKKNQTLILAKSTKFKYLKLTPDFILKNYLALFFQKNIRIIRSAEIIVLHSLSSLGVLASLIAKKQTKILWIGWGADYYSLFEKKGYQLYGPLTKNLFAKNSKPKTSFHSKLKNFLFKLLKYKARNKITIFSPVIFEDYELFMTYFPHSKMRYLPWNYGISVTKNNIENLKPLGQNILIGNSASHTNNHLEIFELLKNIDLTGRRLIVPLSYGDETYRDEIVKIGHELFGDTFHPLIDFMPFEEYQGVLHSCSIALMNHYRQQAVGNINMMILLGAKVFLSERNPYYKTCSRDKVKVFRIEDLINDPNSLFVPLVEEIRIQNSTNIEEDFKQRMIDIQTADIVDVLVRQT